MEASQTVQTTAGLQSGIIRYFPQSIVEKAPNSFLALIKISIEGAELYSLIQLKDLPYKKLSKFERFKAWWSKEDVSDYTLHLPTDVDQNCLQIQYLQTDDLTNALNTVKEIKRILNAQMNQPSGDWFKPVRF